MTEDDKAALLNSQVAPTSKLEGFSPSELITCEACQRANPPGRANCIYCGVTLVSRAAEAAQSFAPAAQPIAEQSGYCVILKSTHPQRINEAAIARIGSLLQVEPAVIEGGIAAGGSLPLLIASDAEQANGLEEELRAFGVEALVVAEEAFATNNSLRKIRGLEFSEDSVGPLPANADEKPTAWSDLVLIVTGRLVTSRLEREEKQKRGSAKPLGTRQLSADESLLDLYVSSDVDVWRIYGNAFDFSCLEARKGVTVFENWAALVNLIRERAPNVEIDESYHRKRSVLAKVWPVEEKSSKREWTLSGARKFNLSTVTTTDNESQFNKYSRLLHYLRLRGRGPAG